jgi:hypothetical protein
VISIVPTGQRLRRTANSNHRNTRILVQVDEEQIGAEEAHRIIQEAKDMYDKDRTKKSMKN